MTISQIINAHWTDINDRNLSGALLPAAEALEQIEFGEAYFKGQLETLEGKRAIARHDAAAGVVGANYYQFSSLLPAGEEIEDLLGLEVAYTPSAGPTYTPAFRVASEELDALTTNPRMAASYDTPIYSVWNGGGTTGIYLYPPLTSAVYSNELRLWWTPATKSYSTSTLSPRIAQQYHWMYKHYLNHVGYKKMQDFEQAQLELSLVDRLAAKLDGREFRDLGRQRAGK